MSRWAFTLRPDSSRILENQASFTVLGLKWYSLDIECKFVLKYISG